MVRKATVVVSVGLGLGVAGVLGPLVATWSTLPDTTQAALLACGPLAAAGFAVASTRWGVRAPVGLLVTAVAASVAASLVLLLGYNPFLDPSCSVVCVDVPARAPALTSRGAAAVSAIALVVTAAATHGESPTLTLRRPLALVSLVATDLMALAFGGWALWWGDTAWQAIRLWAPAVLAGALAATAATGAFVARRRRRRLDHLAEALSKDPSGAGLTDATLVPELLTPEQELGLGIARLKGDLAARVDQVRASQQRIVTRADVERRRIGADLHDGAQQRLVAAALQLRIAAAAADPAATPSFESAESDIHEALQRVRQLSHSIYPAYLATEGLEPALREMVAETHGAVRLDLMLPRPVPDAVAMAVFTVVDAVVRHSSPNDGMPLTVAVVDAGGVLILDTAVPAGVDPRILVHLRDRVGAVGGTLRIEGGRAKVVIPCG
jgi:signal transduction histidine kinase